MPVYTSLVAREAAGRTDLKNNSYPDLTVTAIYRDTLTEYEFIDWSLATSTVRYMGALIIKHGLINATQPPLVISQQAILCLLRKYDNWSKVDSKVKLPVSASTTIYD